MAKIQKYDIAYDFTGANLSIFPHAQGDYIKVSELRKWIETAKAEIDDIEIVTEVERIIKRNKKEILNDLLAAIDTEGK